MNDYVNRLQALMDLYDKMGMGNAYMDANRRSSDPMTGVPGRNQFDVPGMRARFATDMMQRESQQAPQDFFDFNEERQPQQGMGMQGRDTQPMVRNRLLAMMGRR